MNRIRIYAFQEDSARSIFTAIKRLYPKMRDQFNSVEIQITYDRFCQEETAVEVEYLVKDSKMLRSTDKIYHDYI